MKNTAPGEFSATDFISAQYLIALENSHPSNFTMVPGIIDYLTYDDVDLKTGKSHVKRLSVFSAHLYRILIQIGGEEHITWKKSESLAEIANMSLGMIVKCKRELQQKFHQLEGNPLIDVSEHKKSNIKDGIKTCGFVYHKINVKNIWGFNRAFFLLKKLNVKTDSPHESAGVSDSCGESPPPADSPHESASRRTDSLHERNNIQCSKTPLFKKQQSTASADSVCPSNLANVVEDKKLSWFNFLLKIGFDTLSATGIISSYEIEDIRQAVLYTEKQKEINKKKNKPMPNLLGYIRKTLENRWWIPKSI